MRNRHARKTGKNPAIPQRGHPRQTPMPRMPQRPIQQPRRLPKGR
ncbi:hypothetical protein [Spongiactinospora gelatinilytica]|nr:hypothetical protein [Spongiactinospora gelatinilytica]